MTALRNLLKPYQDRCYYMFIVLMSCCAGLGYSSSQLRYLIIFGVASLFLLIKIMTTDYTFKEFKWMVLLAVMVGIVFLINQQKTLIISMMAIFGAKDIKLNQVFKIMFYPRLAATVFTVTMAVCGIIPNIEHELLKGESIFMIKGYGYEHPNTFFINLFVLALLLIVIYQEKLKYYIYILAGGVLFVAYKMVLSRTGWYLYLFTCSIMVIYYLVKKTRYKKWFLSAFLPLAMIVPLFSFAVSFFFSQGSSFSKMLNQLVTGRINLSSQALSAIPVSLFGNSETFLLDNAYLNLFVNYGIVVFLIFIVLYFITMVKLWKCGKDFELMLMGIYAILGFMEVAMLHAFWNPFLLFISFVIFEDSKSLSLMRRRKDAKGESNHTSE